MKQTVVIYNCDLCDSKTREPAGTPEGWITIIREDPHLDRSFIEHVICDGCLALIKQAVAKR